MIIGISKSCTRKYDHLETKTDLEFIEYFEDNFPI